MKVNPSLLKNWQSCSLSVKLAEEHDVPRLVSGNMAFGTAIHAALEIFNEGATVDQAVKFFLASWEHPDLVANQIDYFYPKTSWAVFREKGIDVIKTYAETRMWDAREILGTEIRFAVPFGQHIISGIVDYLEYEAATDTLLIVDFKSGRRPNKDQLHADLQFTSYLYAVHQREFWVGNPEQGERYAGLPNGEELFERFGNCTHKGVWYDLRNNKEYDTGPRGDVDFLRLHRCIDEIERAIEHDVYVPDISGSTCKWCDFQNVCPGYVSPEKTGLSLTEATLIETELEKS